MDKKNNRPEAYPKPTTTDKQLQGQPEYIDQQPNSYEEDISDIPANTEREQGNEKKTEREGEDI